ncbi:MAG: beta-ketoacyl-[acyl-carrier-protein] synthase family protein [Ktedonobacteraceae bacterium]|nr:beta-ketoacyl-[acyl-carrier-protein] synthase family protein [Ktedonobacteraceae bacterium]
MRRVVITGMGVVSPLGNTIDSFWCGLVSGRSATKSLKDIIHCDLFERLGDEFASQVITEVEQFEEAQQLPEHIRQRDRYVQFAVAAALQAVRDAQLDGTDAAMREQGGVAFTTAVGAAKATEVAYCMATENGTEVLDPTKISSSFYLDWLCNTPAILLAQLFDMHGPCDTISSACASGVDVIGLAYEAIRDGDATIMLTVASEAPLAPTRFGGCDVIHCLATGFNDQPGRASRPFDTKRSGFVMGEGAGAFLLEERDHAISRGAHIYAEITGFGLTSNATHMVSLKPAVAPHLTRAIKQAMDKAGVIPEDIDYINPHASSTNQNDQTETRAIKGALGQRAYEVPMSATKSEIGHALATAGFFGAIAAVLSLAKGMIHPTINYEEPDPLCDLDCVPNVARPFTGTHSLVIASGFSGTHATLVLQKAEGEV